MQTSSCSFCQRFWMSASFFSNVKQVYDFRRKPWYLCQQLTVIHQNSLYLCLWWNVTCNYGTQHLVRYINSQDNTNPLPDDVTVPLQFYHRFRRRQECLVCTERKNGVNQKLISNEKTGPSRLPVINVRILNPLTEESIKPLVWEMLFFWWPIKYFIP